MRRFNLKSFLILIVLLSGFSATSYEHEIRTAPLAYFARWATIDYSKNINESWALGPSYIGYYSQKSGNMFFPSYNGYAIGGHLYYYQGGFSNNSWYWGNHLYYEDYESYPHLGFLVVQPSTGDHYQLKGVKFNTKVGYQIVTSDMNILMGLGYELRSYQQTNYKNGAEVSDPSISDQSGGIVYFEFKIGYKF